MKYILRGLEIGEVSLVDKAANKRKFLLIKSEQGGKEMPMTEVIISCDESREELLKSVAEMEDNEISLLKSLMEDDDLEDIKKAGISEKAMKAVKMALGALKGVKDELPKDIMEKLASIGGYEMPKTEKACDEEGKDKMKKSVGGYTIVKNEDGTVDYSDVPEEVRPLVKSLWEQNEESAKQAAEAERIAKEERDARVLKEYVSKAAELKNLATDVDKFGAILKAANEKLDAEQYEELDRVLKAAEEAVAQSVLLKEAGRAGDNDNDDGSAYSKLEKAAMQINKDEGDKFPTFEQAFVEAGRRDPDLAAKERAERV
jgi:hypothetical protein